MALNSILILVSGGALAGILAGLFGIGGGIVLVPVLTYLLKMNQHQASGTSLVALLLPVGLLGVIAYYQAGRIGPFEIKAGLILSGGLFIGTFFGSKIANHLSDLNLRRLFALFLVAVAIQMWFKKG